MFLVKQGTNGKPELHLDGVKLLDCNAGRVELLEDGRVAVNVVVISDEVAVELPDGTKKFLMAVPRRKTLFNISGQSPIPHDGEVELPEPMFVPEGADWAKLWSWAKTYAPDLTASEVKGTGAERVSNCMFAVQDACKASADMLMQLWNAHCTAKGYGLQSE